MLMVSMIEVFALANYQDVLFSPECERVFLSEPR